MTAEPPEAVMRESALAVCTEAYIGSRFESGRHTGRKHMEKHVPRDGQTSSSIFHADIDYWRRDDFLHFQAHYGHVMCCSASLHGFAYAVDRDPRAVTKIQINNINFIKASLHISAESHFLYNSPCCIGLIHLDVPVFCNYRYKRVRDTCIPSHVARRIKC